MKYLKSFQQFTNAPAPSYPQKQNTSTLLSDPTHNVVEGAKVQRNTETVPVFITSQSITSFPVASSVVMIIWQAIGEIFPWGRSHYVLMVIAFGIGILLYFIGMSEKMSTKQKRISFFISLVNSFFLMASAMGILESVQKIVK